MPTRRNTDDLILPAEQELTATDLLLADLMRLDQHFPGGYQVALGIRINDAMTETDKLFTEHRLPRKVELISELKLWRRYIDDGLMYQQRCDHLISEVFRQVKAGEVSR